MNTDQRAMYSGIILTRNNEVTLRWTRTQLFFLIHSAGISFVVTQLTPGTFAHMGGCFLGFYLGILWRRLTIRIGRWVNYWNFRLAALENADPPQPIQIFHGNLYETTTLGYNAHDILLKLVRVFIAVWIILLIASIAQA